MLICAEKRCERQRGCEISSAVVSAMIGIPLGTMTQKNGSLHRCGGAPAKSHYPNAAHTEMRGDFAPPFMLRRCASADRHVRAVHQRKGSRSNNTLIGVGEEERLPRAALMADGNREKTRRINVRRRLHVCARLAFHSARQVLSTGPIRSLRLAIGPVRREDTHQPRE